MLEMLRVKECTSTGEKIQIYIHARQIVDRSDIRLSLPAAFVFVDSAGSVKDLQDEVQRCCPILCPASQQFYKRVGSEEEFQPLNYNDATFLSLNMRSPGPYNLWIDINLQECKQIPNLRATPPNIIEPTKLFSNVTNTSPVCNTHQKSSTLSVIYQNKLTPTKYKSDSTRVTSHRSRRPWTTEEINNLLLGIMKHGISSWAIIASSWKFNNRTSVDLKDKWRNLIKSIRGGTRGAHILSEEVKGQIWRIMQEHNISH